MKLRLITTLFIISLTACATQTQTQTQTPTPAEPSLETTRQELVPPSGPPPLLWEVRGESGSIFLFGTMHFGASRAELPPEVDFALAYCETFVLESDPTSADPRKLADLMMLGEKPSLDEQLGDERWERLLEMIGDRFDARVARRVQPWVLEAALIEQLLPTDEPMEFSLLEEAKRRRMDIEYLEDWETQIRLLNDSTSAETLAEIIDDPGDFKSRTREMTDDYIRGDLDALEAHIFGEYATATLFESRNRDWLPQLERLTDRGNVFVAVGAGHLLGQDSVLELFEERGYQVRRIGN